MTHEDIDKLKTLYYMHTSNPESNKIAAGFNHFVLSKIGEKLSYHERERIKETKTMKQTLAALNYIVLCRG